MSGEYHMKKEKTSEKDLITNEIKKEFFDRGIQIKALLLFGSRARGLSGPESDWDFLVVVDREIDRNERLEIVRLIRSRLAKNMISVDVLVKSEARYMEQSGNVGYITYYAAREGVPA